MLHKFYSLALAGLLLFTGSCANPDSAPSARPTVPAGEETAIVLADSGVTVAGQAASTDSAAAVYVGGEIVYYHDGTDETYGEGEADEAHSAQEAAAHTLVTITKAGTYRLSGTLSKGQIAVDLGGGR